LEYSDECKGEYEYVDGITVSAVDTETEYGCCCGKVTDDHDGGHYLRGEAVLLE
jgi:hypothetical protein